MAAVGFGLLGVLLLMTLLLCVPVCLRVRYRTDEPVQAELRWLLLRFDLMEAKDRPEKPEKKPKRAPKEKPAPAKAEPEEFSEKLHLVLDLIGSLKGAAGMLARNFKLYDIVLRLVVAGEDAADTAIAYGRVNAIVYTCYGYAKRFLRMSEPTIDIRPDFLAKRGTVDFAVSGRLTPLVALGAAIRGGWAFLMLTLKRRKETEKPEENEPKRPAATQTEETSDIGGRKQ